MENKIAVIIPAYKDTYLLNTLISINNQTDKKFNLYICNDSSPYNIEKVLADFKKINKKVQFFYKNISHSQLTNLVLIAKITNSSKRK